MSKLINGEELEQLLNQPRALRSLLDQGKVFFRLNDQKTIEIVENKNNEAKLLIDFEEANTNFEQIEDPVEKAEAYRDLARSLGEIVKKDRADSQENLLEKSELISEQRKKIEELENESKLINEQLLNSKELINESDGRKTELLEKIELLTREKTELNTQLEKINTTFQGFNIDEVIENIKKAAEQYQNINRPDLNETIGEISLELNQLKPALVEIQGFLQNQIMQVEAKDVIAGIPMFNGDIKQLDGFVNSCELYYNMVEQNQRDTVLKIIKAKITGEALSKAGPFADTINTWALLKKRLIEKIKKPVSIEYAQEDLNQVFQKKDESIEDYGSRVKSKLKKLNEAIKTLSENDEQSQVLRKMNEKLAISKFEQNIRDSTIKVLVSAAGKLSLDECVSFAMQKELTEMNKNIKTCNFCGIIGHEEKNCRRKNNNSGGNSNQKKFSGNGNSQQNRNTNKNNQNSERKQFTNSSKNDEKPSSSGFSSNNWKSQKSNFQQNKNNNEKPRDSQKSVKTVSNDEKEDLKTVKEVLDQANGSKN